MLRLHHGILHARKHFPPCSITSWPRLLLFWYPVIEQHSILLLQQRDLLTCRCLEVIVRKRLLVPNNLAWVTLLVPRVVFLSFVAESLPCLWITNLLFIGFVALEIGWEAISRKRRWLARFLFRIGRGLSFGTSCAFAATSTLLAAFFFIRFAVWTFNLWIYVFLDLEWLTLLMNTAGLRKFGFGWWSSIGPRPVDWLWFCIIVRPFTLTYSRTLTLFLNFFAFDLNLHIRHAYRGYVLFVRWAARFSVLIINRDHLGVVLRRRDSCQVELRHLLIVRRTHSRPLIPLRDRLQPIELELQVLLLLLLLNLLATVVHLLSKSKHQITACKDLLCLFIPHCLDQWWVGAQSQQVVRGLRLRVPKPRSLISVNSCCHPIEALRDWGDRFSHRVGNEWLPVYLVVVQAPSKHLSFVADSKGTLPAANLFNAFAWQCFN